MSHQSCFWLSTCLTVSSISLKATSEAFFLSSGATSLLQTSSRSRNPISASRKRRNGTSASTTRKAIALAKFARSFSRNARSPSLVSARTDIPGRYPRNAFANNPALFGNFLGGGARALRPRM